VSFDPFVNFEFLEDRVSRKLIKSLGDFKSLLKLVNMTEYIKPVSEVPSKRLASGVKKSGGELQ
jgi:hypothetical protein